MTPEAKMPHHPSASVERLLHVEFVHEASG